MVKWSLVVRASERANGIAYSVEKEGEGTGFMGATKSTCIALLRWLFPFSTPPSSLTCLPTKTVQGRAGRHFTRSNSKAPFYFYLVREFERGRTRSVDCGVTLDISVAGNSATTTTATYADQ